MRKSVSIVLFFIICSFLNAQNINQLKKIAEDVKAGKITQAEAMKKAKEEGVTDMQLVEGIEKAKEMGYVKDNSQNSNPVLVEKLDEPELDESILKEKVKQEAREDVKELMEKPDLAYFGYELFSDNRDLFSVFDVGPVDPNYQVGPGDEIIISMWGETEMRKTLTVSREGTIFIDNYGQVSVVGLTIDNLQNKLVKNLSKVYNSLMPQSGSPTTYLDISLGKMKKFIVFLVGHINKPGAVAVNTYSTAFNALYIAGGPSIDGSLRDIQVIRNGKVVSNIDLYDFILTGNKIKDIRLQNNDVIYIPPRISTISLKGEVKRAGIYELKKNETLKDIIDFSGGLKTTVDYSRVQVERIIPFEQRPSIEKIRDVFDFELVKKNMLKTGQVNNLALMDEDIITLYPIVDPQLGYVTINGAIYREGKYALEENMTIAQLIKKANGLKEEAFLDKADLTRTFRDGKTQHIEINLNTDSSTFILTDWDELHIYSYWDLHKEKSVNINGHISFPGKYILHDGMTVKDLIHKAGGLYDTVFWNNTYKMRADLIRYNEDELTRNIIPIRLDSLILYSKGDIVLKNRDSLLLYNANVNFFRYPVSIYGEIYKPGIYTYQENLKAHDIILRAGGFKREAYKHTIEIYRIEYDRPNISSLSLFKKIDYNSNILDTFSVLNDIELKERDIIIVRKKPDFENQRVVQIIGEVYFPGSYPLLDKNESFHQLLERAGGLTDEAFPQGITFYRGEENVVGNYKNIVQKRNKLNIYLKDGDKIIIPNHPGTIQIDGSVNSPGLVQYQKGWNLNNYIEAAGDYSFNAYKRKTIIYYPGGNAKRKGLMASRNIPEGAKVYVPEKPEKKSEFNMTQFVTNLASITASLISIVYIYTVVSK